uniref:C-type lectin domain-containing protein n=1 Tax=Panagrolaimus sp. PS1159 TaxID=55785 RepID=A0AC35ETD9_9BILA
MTTTQGNTAPTTTASTQKCTGNFTYYGPTNSCYGVFFTFDPDARGWNASETFCQSINGHLASIHSQDEFNFIMNFNYPQNSEYWPWVGLFSNDNEQTFQCKFLSFFKFSDFNYPQNSEYWPWVGLFSNDNEQTFQWSDGTPTDFLPWGPGEPYVDTNFNCVFANSGGIDTLDCSEPGTALCKIKLN